MKGLTKTMLIAALSIAFLSIFTSQNLSIVSRMSCEVLFYMENIDRHCYGGVYTECPPNVHSVPFGNWGVESNAGYRIDDHQFQGWKDTGKWLEWNSCTKGDYAPPNCYYYNVASCTQQHTTTNENIYGWGIRRYEIPQIAYSLG